ncbi:class I SAM-dependent methyltransferase, partial [Spirulina sp. 06S082]|uniref:class I SAM-dependent methyltransferase n=1 Tax=Spirulina sp. 06S082 TaxID=3110248 RepID=UPI002B220708
MQSNLPTLQPMPLNWLEKTINDKLKKSIQVRLEKVDIQINGSRPWDIQVHNERLYQRVLLHGSLGLGEAYMEGWWDCPQLDQFFVHILRGNLHEEVAPRNLSSLWEAAIAGITNLQSLARSFQVGEEHYDLGNDMFQLFLDPTMIYSSAIFDTPQMSLEQASVSKLDRICRKLELKPEDHVIEIGAGWGGFAMHAAQHYGCKVTTTTISQAQYALAKERIEAAGLTDRIHLLLQDYRDLEGQFDKLVSIEMIEAVGHEYYDTFFAKCASLLKPEGMMLLQGITIADQRYESAKNAVDFIQRYIFPGSCIPSVTALLESSTRASDLRLFNLEDIGPHYARTLAEWRINFFNHIEQVRALGYSEEFIRMWEYYLCYCEGG